MAILDVGPIRGMRNVEGKLFVVAAQTLYQISNTGVAIPYGTIPGVGRVSMAHNQSGLGNELIVVNGSAGYVFDTNVNILTKITDEGYPGAFIADYIDQYLAQVEPQGRFWFHSDLANGTDYNTLDRYEAEADPDRIVSLLVSHREVLVFGRDTIEPFVNTGGQTGTFERASNTVIEVGCAAKFTPRKLDNSVFWLDDKRLVRRLDGYTPIRVSTDAIDSAFQECSEAEVANCYAFTWESRGHKVYYITIPGRFTFGYDVLTRSWHRRSTWGLEHWDVVDAVYWNGRWIVGSGRYGRLYELDWDYKLDACDPLVRKRVTGKLWDDENDLTLNNVELKFNTGGPDSVCVLFPDQPTGPTITGAPPGGSVGIAYAGYTFTTTPGDAPIARTIILTGELPTGLSWNQNTATISTATPTETGLFSFTLRTIDTNGLYADLDVEIPIATVMMALYETSAAANDSWITSSGIAWNGSWTPNDDIQNRRFLIPTGSAFIAYGTTGFPAYTTDFGATWSLSTGTAQSGIGGERKGWYSSVADLVMLPQGSGGTPTISTDNGASFSPVTTIVSNMIVAVEPESGTKWISGNSYGEPFATSEDNGTTWDTIATPSGLNDQVYGWATGETAWIASAVDSVPSIWQTSGDGSYELQTLPSLSGVRFNGVAGGIIDGQTRVVAWTNTGELVFRDPETGDWALATDQPDGIPDSVDCNGAVLAMTINKDNVSDNQGEIVTSVDGNNWTQRRVQSIGNTEFFRGIAALVG